MKIRWFKNNNLFALIVILLVLGALSIVGYLNSQKIQRKGIFAIATITEANPSKSGTRVKAIFHYHNKSYLIKFNPSYSFDVSIGRRFFIKFLPNDPMMYDHYDINVPSCIKDT